jgi:Cytidine and deoxycytidylate deaminase zinc-binding region
MRVLYGTEADQAMSHITYVARLARSAACRRSRCGSVIVSAGRRIGTGVNAPPAGLVSQQRCLRRHELAPGFKSDTTCCIHAEQRAVMDALRNHADRVPGSRLYFIRLDAAGRPQIAGRPYCTHCSKLALDVRIAEFALWQAGGITIYDTVEYNDLSYAWAPEL